MAWVRVGGYDRIVAMDPPAKETLSAWLSERLPPGEAAFSEIARAYIAFPRPAFFLQTLTHLEKEVDVYEGGRVVTRPLTFMKLAETLLLHQQVFVRHSAAEPGEQAIRRAYLHYIVNTDGPIPLRQAADDFDVFAWAAEYAATFNITLKRSTRADGEPETLMTVDDPQSPVRCKDWARAEGRSSAWALRDVGHLINYRRYGRYDVIPSRLFTFDAQALSHSRSNAMWLSDFSQLVYMREGYVRTSLAQWGFERVRWIEDKATDTQAVVAARSGDGTGHLVVAFRGTEGGKDFLTDLRFRKGVFHAGATGAQPVGQVHRGFATALESVWGQVLAAVRELGPDRPIFVCGHSLGAALAQLAAMRLVGHGRNVAAVYVYGSPRVGNADFCDAYNGALKERTFLHINDQDVVTTVPPRWAGFDHVAQPARRFDVGHQITSDDGAMQSEPTLPPGQDEEAANRELMARAAQVLQDSHRYLGVRDLRAGPATGMTYGAAFEQGRLDDHGIAQYLFKFACSIIDEKITATGGPA